MNKLIVIAIASFLGIASAHSQITHIEVNREPEKPTMPAVVERYDSLSSVLLWISDMSNRNVAEFTSRSKKYIGQRLYLPALSEYSIQFPDPDRTKHRKHNDREYYNLYTSQITAFPWDANLTYSEYSVNSREHSVNAKYYKELYTNLYKPEEVANSLNGVKRGGWLTQEWNKPQGYAQYYSSTDSVTNQSYLLTDILSYRLPDNEKLGRLNSVERRVNINHDSQRGGDNIVFELVREQTQDTVYTNSISRFISVGFLEKAQRLFLGEKIIPQIRVDSEFEKVSVKDEISGKLFATDSLSFYCSQFGILEGRTVAMIRAVWDADASKEQTIMVNVGNRITTASYAGVVDVFMIDTEGSGVISYMVRAKEMIAGEAMINEQRENELQRQQEEQTRREQEAARQAVEQERKKESEKEEAKQIIKPLKRIE